MEILWEHYRSIQDSSLGIMPVENLKANALVHSATHLRKLVFSIGEWTLVCFYFISSLYKASLSVNIYSINVSHYCNLYVPSCGWRTDIIVLILIFFSPVQFLSAISCNSIIFYQHLDCIPQLSCKCYFPYLVTMFTILLSFNLISHPLISCNSVSSHCILQPYIFSFSYLVFSVWGLMSKDCRDRSSPKCINCSIGTLKVGLLYICFMWNKVTVTKMIHKFDLDILCVTETWLFESDINII